VTPPAGLLLIPRRLLLAALEGLLIAALVMGLVSVGAATGVDASRGRTTPTLQASMVTRLSADSGTAFSATVAVDGWGFASDALVAISVANPGCCAGFSVRSDSAGQLHFEIDGWAAGTYYIKALDASGSKVKVVASTSIVVN
jgi:hypothetical protein